ncbi:MAG: hypothetical protein M3N19_01710 [Candidatus Eremiobacteraeota bacterium]|nr:hypothetical protein [Candidatus Eremiobacteraeota bacterium]
MSSTSVNFGPRLVGHPTGTLRAAMLIRPNNAVESLPPLHGESGAIYKRALEQHGILVNMLKYFGVDVTVVEPSDPTPLAVAVNDLAVCFENGAVIMRPAALSRTPQIAALENEFARIDIPIMGQIAAPGILSGSDVLLAGDTAFIAVSKNSNALGRAAFAQIAQSNGYRAVEIQLAASAPSLRSVANAVANDAIVVGTDCVDEAALRGFTLIKLERGEELGAGVFPLGERRVAANMRFRTSLEQLRRAGVAVESIDLYDFGKIGLTPSNLILSLKRA